MREHVLSSNNCLKAHYVIGTVLGAEDTGGRKTEPWSQWLLTGRDKQEGQDITTAVLWERVCDGNARTLIRTGGERAAKPSRTRLPQDVEDALGRQRGATAVARSGVSAGEAVF